MKDVCDEAKNIRTKYVAKTKTASFRALSDEDKQKESNKAFYAFVKAIEREKMYFFVLAVQTDNPVLLVKSPSSNAEMKKFLGYEWVNRKGSEGIKYLNVTTTSESDDEEGNEAEDDTMQQISGIDSINTCLFKPDEYDNNEKINYLIRQNFLGENVDVANDLEEYVDQHRLIDLIDFTRTAFDKTIKTNPVLAYPKFETSLRTEKLGEIAPFVTEKIDYSAILADSYISTDNMLQNRAGIVAYDGIPNVGKVTHYKKGDILILNIRPYLKKIYFAQRDGGCSNDVLVFRNTKDYIQSEYLYALLSTDLFFDYMMTGKTGLKMPRGDKKVIPNFGIPVPDKNIQEKIVKEFFEAERVIFDTKGMITELENEVLHQYHDSQSVATIDLRLDNEQIFDLSIGRRVLRSELKKDGEYEVYSANVFEPFGRVNTSLLSDFTTPSVLWGIDGDWMVNHLPAERPFHPTDHCGVIKVLDENVVLSKYLVYPLLKAGEHERFSRANRASTERIKALTIRVPSIDMQRETIARVLEIENKIDELKQQIAVCQSNKQSILDKYLK